jgi:hypothetical protein
MARKTGADGKIAWKRLRGVTHAILPPSTTRPNPVVVGDPTACRNLRAGINLWC